jgi:hypothetical protein
MGKWVSGLVVVAAALAAPSSLAQGVLVRSVFHTADVSANSITTFRVSCPPGFAATSAGISRPGPGVTTLGIRPAGVRAYTFRFGNPVTNSDEQVTVVVACRRFLLKPGTKLKVVPLRVKVTVPPRKLRPADFLCPPGTVPSGGAVDVAPFKGQRYVPGAPDRLSVRRLSMHLNGFGFTIRNEGKAPRSVVVYGTCLTAPRPAGSSPERLQVRITTFRTPVRPGTHQVIRRCPRGWAALGAGYSLRSPRIHVPGAAALGASGSWTVSSDLGGTTTADLQLVCARLI